MSVEEMANKANKAYFSDMIHRQMSAEKQKEFKRYLRVRQMYCEKCKDNPALTMKVERVLTEG